jgi:hypothetical protein
MTRKLILPTLIACCISGCAGDPQKPPPAASDPCATIGQILESYQTDFSDIRGQRRSLNRIDIWSSKLQLVGNSCEIWEWQGGKYNYVCNYTAPDEATARSTYQQAATNIGACASAQWQRAESSTQQAGGEQTLWRHQDVAAVVDLKLVPTRGISKPRWAVYLLIGDYNPDM